MTESTTLTNHPEPTTVAANVARVRERIAAAAERAGRPADAVTLVAVSKTVEAARIRQAHRAGVRHFGENRVQEAAAKLPELARELDAVWHLVGHLQRNKVKAALEHFDWVQSVDSERLARELDRRVAEGRESGGVRAGAKLTVLIEVNTSGESAKMGVRPEEAPRLVEAVASLAGLELRGFMTVGPLADDPEETRAAFRALRRLAERERQRAAEAAAYPVLSMGMTDDLEIAVEEGSTLVRVGRAIFGERAR